MRTTQADAPLGLDDESVAGRGSCGRLALVVVLAVVVAGCARASRGPGLSLSVDTRSGCVPVGEWVLPGSGEKRTTAEILNATESARVILLGEDHDRPEHHRWQLQMLAALYGRRTHMLIGFEMLPRSSQAALDEWVTGEIDAKEFLRRSRWYDVWPLPARLYMPLLAFARMNRMPVRALNVERRLVTRVAERGWAAVPPREREGLSEPAPPREEYTEFLRKIHEQHAADAEGKIASERSLEHFIQAQLVWDRAFAEALAEAAEANPGALVVGIVGRGHVEHGYGVPHQLAALGIREVMVLLPWNDARDCGELVSGVADAVFGVETVEPAARMTRMGVLLAQADAGVRITEVVPASAAEKAGVRPGDLVVEAAGTTVADATDLRLIVGEREPGDCMPLVVSRDGERLEPTVCFPSSQ